MLSTAIFAVLLPSFALIAVIFTWIFISGEISSGHVSRGLRLAHTQLYLDHKASLTSENIKKKHLHHHQKPTPCPTSVVTFVTPVMTLPLASTPPYLAPSTSPSLAESSETTETRKLVNRNSDVTALKDNSSGYSDNYYGGDDVGYYAIPSLHAHAEVESDPCTLVHSFDCITYISDLCNSILINEDDADYCYIVNLCGDPQIIPTLANYEDALAYLQSLQQRGFENKEIWLLETALIDATLDVDLKDDDNDDIIYATWRPPFDDRFKWDDYYYSTYDDVDDFLFGQDDHIEIANLRSVHYDNYVYDDYDDYYSWIAALDDYPVEDDISAVSIAHSKPKFTYSSESIRARSLTRKQLEIDSRAQLVSLSYDNNTNDGDQNQTKKEDPFDMNNGAQGDQPLEYEHGREDDFDDINIFIENPPSENDQTAEEPVVEQKKSFSTDIYKVALFGGVMFISSYIAFRVLMTFRSNKFDDNTIVPGAKSKDRRKGRNSRTDSDFSDVADVESGGGNEINHYRELENTSNFSGNDDLYHDTNRRSRDLDLGIASYGNLDEITSAAALPFDKGNNEVADGSDEEEGRDGGDGGDFSSYLYNYFTNNYNVKNALPIAKHTYSSSDSMGTISRFDLLRRSIGSSDKYSSGIDLQSVETIDGSNHYSASTASSQSRSSQHNTEYSKRVAGRAGGDAASSDGDSSTRVSKLRSLEEFKYNDMPYESDEDIDDDQDQDEECTESSLPSSIHSNNSDITNSSSTVSSFEQLSEEGSLSNSSIASSTNSRKSSSIGFFKYSESAIRSNVKYDRI